MSLLHFLPSLAFVVLIAFRWEVHLPRTGDNHQKMVQQLQARGICKAVGSCLQVTEKIIQLLWEELACCEVTSMVIKLWQLRPGRALDSVRPGPLQVGKIPRPRKRRKSRKKRTPTEKREETGGPADLALSSTARSHSIASSSKTNALQMTTSTLPSQQVKRGLGPSEVESTCSLTIPTQDISESYALEVASDYSNFEPTAVSCAGE